jgi:carbamoyltransferase
MGLAPYGNPSIDLSFFCKPVPEGFFCDPKFFRSRKAATSLEPYYSKLLLDQLGNPRRKGEPISQMFKDIAASTQLTLETSLVSLVTKAFEMTNEKALCLAGGVALNCSANRLLYNLPFISELFVQPASSDRGLPLGCALFMAFICGEKIEPIPHVFYGPSQSPKEIESAISVSGVSATKVENPAIEAAKRIATGEIVGWFQGRSEFGPRALGHRSILANPTIANMKDQINAKVKFREEFRPFAPSVLEENSFELFEMSNASPYMTIAFNVKSPWNSLLKSTTHVNNTGRVQTVNKHVDPYFHLLISEVKNQIGCPAVLNTSFNIKGQPIVEKPLEAISTFYGTGLDSLLLGNYLITK